MRLAHLADLHIGFRQFDRSNPAGANQREADVAEALRRAMDAVIAARPDAVLLAGDVFHSVRPTNHAILRLFAELQRLRAALPGAAVVMISGNHDTPHRSETGTILALYRALGVHVVERQPERIRLPGLVVTTVPELAIPKAAELVPEPGVLNVLLIHGEARGHFTQGVTGRLPDVGEATLAAAWDYVALGHYHVSARVAPQAWYSGSLDYVSSDPWGELREQAKRGLPGKGWLLVELAAGAEPAVAFQPVQPPRRFVDLPALDAEGLGAAEIDAELEARAADIEDAVVRQVVTNLSRETARALDHAAIRARKGRALHYLMDARRPAPEATTVEARALRMRRLDEIVDEFLGARALPPDLDRAEFKRLGQEYLALAMAGNDPYTGEPTGGSGQQ
jgi:DNA repair protein SbcD/Mre11